MNKHITLIVFTGKKLSGKSTARKYLVEKYNYMHLRFADSIKDMLCEFGLTREEVDGNLKEAPCAKLGGRTPVYAMQTLGTEWGRDLMYQNIWIDALNRELECYIDKKLTRFVIDDLRFINEKEYIDKLKEKYNVLIVRMERKGTAVGEHRSETEMDSMVVDIFIENNYKELYRLHNILDNIINRYVTNNKE